MGFFMQSRMRLQAWGCAARVGWWLAGGARLEALLRLWGVNFTAQSYWPTKW